MLYLPELGRSSTNSSNALHGPYMYPMYNNNDQDSDLYSDSVNDDNTKNNYDFEDIIIQEYQYFLDIINDDLIKDNDDLADVINDDLIKDNYDSADVINDDLIKDNDDIADYQ